MRSFASTLIRDDKGRYLVLHSAVKKDSPWRFPGGKIEPGELPAVAAERELWEEVGLEADLRFFRSQSIRIDSGDWFGHIFYAKLWGGTPAIREPAKHDKISWMSPAELHVVGSDFESELAFAFEHRF
jgi:8-oxo-dGTP diphosphatase